VLGNESPRDDHEDEDERVFARQRERAHRQAEREPQGVITVRLKPDTTGTGHADPCDQIQPDAEKEAVED
jgi:hypothetical protein